MNMKNLIQQLTDLETNQKLNESLEECGDQTQTPQTEHPVSVNITAAGKSHVNDLLGMMKNAGLENAEEVGDETVMPMRHDIEKFRSAVDVTPGEDEMNTAPEFTGDIELEKPALESNDEYEEEHFANAYSDDEDEEEYQDTAYMTKDIAGGINREKDAYPSAQPGDNAMKADIRKKLETRLKEMMKR